MWKDIFKTIHYFKKWTKKRNYKKKTVLYQSYKYTNKISDIWGGCRLWGGVGLEVT